MLDQNQLMRLILGFKVKHLRLQKGLSYFELAEQTGLSKSYLNDIEKGKKYPRASKLAPLAEVLGVDYDDLVSRKAGKKLQPVIDLLSSRLFTMFPLEEFGLDAERLMELFTRSPERTAAFLSTLTNLARHYKITDADFFKVALRSWQDIHNNYFEEIEQEVLVFRELMAWDVQGLSIQVLEKGLLDQFGVQVDYQHLGTQEIFNGIRSYYAVLRKTLYIHPELNETRIRFLLARELGFHHLKLEHRPYVMRIQKMDSFDKLLNNFRASYFGAALLMDEQQMIQDFRGIAQQSTWDPSRLLSLLDKYQVTPEMYLQRLTNLLPKHFGLGDLFFLRMANNEASATFNMTKELHLSQLHQPSINELDEHYCRRWISITLFDSSDQIKEQEVLADAQISSYWQTEDAYLCLTLMHRSFGAPNQYSTVTLGLSINPELRGIVRFLDDPNLKRREVHTTCERCSMRDCRDRIAPPKRIDQMVRTETLEQALKDLDTDELE